ncbi:MAG TPA: flagellar motor protein MotB [Povalibacter sp.]|uniref:flagellar motor protein MotB n=1 Tax=Povalibacter sp. TaxID=1962978 RepID=UPI002BDD62D7|nr:flagellar motor protein MotB [Povalibacter sp.]HMN43144.1 flagellar motor protein MotB [Povalibacter sp.]
MPSAPDKAGRPDKAGEIVIRRVVRKHGADGHGGSAWKVAFADFCLALLALFLVLWLLATREQERLQELLKTPGSLIDEGRGRLMDSMGGPRGSLISREPMPSRGDQVARRSLASGDSDPAGPGQGIRLSKTLYETRADMMELVDVLDRISESAGLSANVHSLITPYGLRVLLHDTDRRGMFRRGSAVPSDAFVSLLHRLGPLFDQIENQMVISGHTDSLQYAERGPDGMSNWQLSSARAMAARTHLLAGGMPSRSVLQVVGLADSAPLNRGDTAAHENRRIELLILTRGQARSISAMFGAPGETQPLIDGADTSLPDYEALDALRSQVTPGGR